MVGTLTSTDVDAGDCHTYALSGTDADSFEIDASTGELKLKSTVTADYETQTSYTVTVTATDSGGLTTSETFAITVTDINDAPTLANAIADQNINEDSALSYTVPTNTFNDIDVGDSFTSVSYTHLTLPTNREV